MIGIALAYFLFPAFNSDTNLNAWLNVYLLLAFISLLSFGFLFFTKFDLPVEIPGSDLLDDFRKMGFLLAKLLTIIFVISAFLFVMIEQGIMSWLPTFNAKVLHLPENISIMMASILAISLAVGRLLAGVITKKINTRVQIYANPYYNRYIYKGNHYIPADKIPTTIREELEEKLFKGRGHLKRGKSMTQVPPKWLKKEYYDFMSECSCIL